MFKKIFNKNILPYLLVVFLLIVISAQYFEIRGLKYDEKLLYYYVPHVELSNIQFKSDATGEYLVYATGFVKFKSISDQPKGMWQYQVIEPTNKIDKKGNRIYLLTDIIKMHYLPPKKFDPVELTMVDESELLLTLTDAGGNVFRVNKDTQQISMFDTTSDSTTLITNQSDYENFMRSFVGGY